MFKVNLITKQVQRNYIVERLDYKKSTMFIYDVKMVDKVRRLPNQTAFCK